MHDDPKDSDPTAADQEGARRRAKEVEALREELSSKAAAMSALEETVAKLEASRGRMRAWAIAVVVALAAGLVCMALVFERAVDWTVRQVCPPGAVAQGHADDAIRVARSLLVNTPQGAASEPCTIDGRLEGPEATPTLGNVRIACNGASIFDDDVVKAHDGRSFSRVSRRALTLHYVAAWDDDTGGNLVCVANQTSSPNEGAAVVLHARESSRQLLTSHSECFLPPPAP